MKKIAAFKCDYCPKITGSYSGMYSHEKICFHNPKSKSCVTCSKLGTVMVINGIKLTDEESDILALKVKGTYTTDHDTDPEGDGEEYLVLNPEYEYLYNAEPVNYCSGYDSILFKLSTKCDRYKQDKPF